MMVYSLVVTDVAVARIVLADVIPVMAVLLESEILTGPDVMIEKVVVTPGAYVVTTRIYVPPD
jgi:hypothetical protein